MPFRRRVEMLFSPIWTAAVSSTCGIERRVESFVSFIMLVRHSVSVFASAAAIYSASQMLLPAISCSLASY